MNRVDVNSPEAFEIISDRVKDAASVMKAMSSETRLRILCALSGGELPVNQLAEMTGQSSSAISQHLTKLRAAGLVDSRREAQTIYYFCTKGIGKEIVDTLCAYYKSDDQE